MDHIGPIAWRYHLGHLLQSAPAPHLPRSTPPPSAGSAAAKAARALAIAEITHPRNGKPMKPFYTSHSRKILKKNTLQVQKNCYNKKMQTKFFKQSNLKSLRKRTKMSRLPSHLPSNWMDVPYSASIMSSAAFRSSAGSLLSAFLNSSPLKTKHRARLHPVLLGFG